MADDKNNAQEPFTDSPEKTVLSEKFGDGIALKDVNISLSAILGKTSLRVHQLLKLGRGAVVELNHKKNDKIEILANDILIAKGEIIVTETNKVGIKVTEILKSQSNS